MRRSLGLLCLLLAPAGCPDEAPAPAPAGPDLSGPMPRRMANCPSAVPGAVTQTLRTIDGISVTVTATDPPAVRQIIARAEFHARFPEPILAIPHVGLGGGGGGAGHCPIGRDAARRTVSIIPGGVRIHLGAGSRWEARELQRSVEARAARLRGSSST